MSNYSRDFNRFLARNRDRGIPNLMLWLCAAAMGVYLLSLLGNMGGQFAVLGQLAGWLKYDASLILKGQVWRLVSFVFTFLIDTQGVSISGLLLSVISVMFYTWLGRTLEAAWGRLKFNLYYFSGILLLSLTALLLQLIFPDYPIRSVSTYYVNLSLFIAVATIIPEQRVLFMMFIPIKMKWLAIVDLALTTLSVLQGMDVALMMGQAYGGRIGLVCALCALLPVVGLLNYLLFFGRDIGNLFGRRVNRYVPPRPPRQPAAVPGRSTRTTTGQSYHHKCTICGRTDTDCPGLEFRYCSRCRGYFCYCIDHINNHEHVQ